MSELDALTANVLDMARIAGFDQAGICSSQLMGAERNRYLQWLDAGRQGEMKWLTPSWAMRASDPATLVPEAASVVCVALSYSGSPPRPTPPENGRIARYASGRDYHLVLGEKLRILATNIQNLGGSTVPFVDTAPTMDKALATRAGLGWQAKNTNVLNRELGSFTFLGGVITTLKLEPTAAVADGCGNCRACVVACPTGALKGDYTIDARLCISYLTIEHRGAIPRELRSLIGDWVFGCDICQDVCPVVSDVHDRRYPNERSRRITFTRQTIHRGRRAKFHR